MVKALLMIAMVMFAASSFASEMTTPAQDSYGVLDELSMGEFSLETRSNDSSVERDQNRAFYWMCYSRNIFNHTFWGRDWNRRYAQNLAMYACQTSPFAIGCRPLGCERRWY